MKVTGWHIDGYGIHHDTGVDSLPRGLTVVGGPNEAGKTTLQHFLVGMLFGFTASNRPDHHAPLRGGTYGGRLFVTADDGTHYTIARGARRSSLQVTGPDGPVADPELELRHLLGGATKDLYEAIFAVHTDELAELRALSDEQVRDRVFSAGVLGAGRTARAAIDQLAGERDQLLKPGGRTDKYVIKRLRGDLVDARAQLAEVRRAATGLPALVHRISVLEQDRERERAARTQLQDQRSLLFAVNEQWPSWADAAEARSELDQLGAVDPLPADAAARLDQAVARQADLRRVAEAAADDLAEADAALDALDLPGPALAQAEAIAALAAALPVERQRATTIAELDARARELAGQLDDAWLADLPDAVDAGATLRAAAGTLAAADARIAHLADAHRRSRAELDDARAEQDAHEATLAAAPTHPVERARQAAEDAAALVTLIGQRDAVALRPTPAPAGRALVPGLLAGAALVALAGAIALATGAPLAGGVALVAAAILVATAVAMRPKPAAAPADHGLDAAIDDLVRSLGLDACPTLADATNLRSRADHLATEAGRLQHERELAAQRRRALDERAARLEQRHHDEQAEAEAALADAQRGWARWLEDHGLPATLDPIAATELLDAAERARTVQRALEQTRAELARAQADHADYLAQVQQLIPEPGPDPFAAVDELAATLRRDLDAARRRDAAVLQRDAAARHHDHAARRAVDAAADVDALIAELGAATVADARLRIDRATRAEDLRRRIAQAERDLTAAIGSLPERLAAARTLLGQADPTRWRTELAALDRDLRAADESIDAITTELAHLQRERDELERSADVPAAELRVADLEAQLLAAVTRWASLTVAHQLVEATLARYQRERQPDVVLRAAAHFAQVTDGRYPRLEVREQSIVAIDRAGREVPADALSKGAIQQLYLCMRFALAESYARTAALPLLLDDVTVHADDGRLPQLAEVIATVAADHQVLVFTCHDRTVDLLQSACPDARVLGLERVPATRPVGLAAG